MSHSRYPPASDPADNATLFRKYREGNGIQFQTGYVKENNTATGPVWVLQNTEVNTARYMALFDTPPPGTVAPTDQIEALERAGATYYRHWFECEVIRHVQSPTLTTDIAFGKRERTVESMAEAERELDENPMGLEAAQIVEERKTLAWLKEEIRGEVRVGSHGEV